MNRYHGALKRAKGAYHQEKIAKADNKELFHVVQKMSVEQPDQVLPSHKSKTELSQKFASFFPKTR